jgi:hypothetical protein
MPEPPLPVPPLLASAASTVKAPARATTSANIREFRKLVFSEADARVRTGHLHYYWIAAKTRSFTRLTAGCDRKHVRAGLADAVVRIGRAGQNRVRPAR